MTRPELHTAKGVKRRDALLNAAAELIAERGYAGVSHRAVAERAGVPAATTTYFFSSINELVREAATRAQRRQIDRLIDLADEFLKGDYTIDQGCWMIADAMLSMPTARVITHYEVYLNATREPALVAAASASVEEFVALVERVLARLGVDRAQETARAVVAVVDGLMLHHLIDPDPRTRDRMHSALVAVLGGSRDEPA